MTFQHHRAKTAEWRDWLRKHRSTLAECGLPDSVSRDRPRWYEFLNHGYCHETGWRLDYLSPRCAGVFYHFLVVECSDTADGWLLDQLRRKCNQEWLNAVEPGQMLPSLPVKVSARKLRLWAVACCRRGEDTLTDKMSRRAIAVTARFADGLASVEELAEARAAAADVLGDPDDEAADPHPGILAAVRAADFPFRTDQALASAADAARAAARAPYPVAIQYAPYAAAIARERLIQCQLLRCVFGNPSAPLTGDQQWQRWNDGCVTKIATVIYREERFEELPVLADTLEEAGLNDPELVGHLRAPGPHARGCFSLDILLGKS